MAKPKSFYSEFISREVDAIACKIQEFRVAGCPREALRLYVCEDFLKRLPKRDSLLGIRLIVAPVEGWLLKPVGASMADLETGLNRGIS